MVSVPSIHNHAVERLKERFGVDESWLRDKLEQGEFVWLKGSGNSCNAKYVRSGHLIYLPSKNEYCIVVMDDRSRIAITVLTEDMALNSSWGKGLDKAAKLKAKRLALGEEAVRDINFLFLYAEDRSELSVTIQAKTISYDWNPLRQSISKIKIKPEQIDIDRNCCTLSNEQMDAVSKSISEKIANKEIRPYCELSLRTGRGKTALISNKLNVASDLENAELAMRWET
jgi:hypothetical protein